MNGSRLTSKFSMLALSLLMVEFAPSAQASTYSCTAVDNKAVLGTKDSDSVSITTGKKTCAFSINGASVDQKSAPPDFLNALNMLLAGQLDNFSQSSSEVALTLLLMGPNGSQSEKSQIENALRPSLQDIGKCIASARQYSDTISFTGGPSSVESNQLTCTFLPRTEKGPSKAFGPVEVIATDAILRLGVQVGDQTHLIFIPSQLIQRGKGGFRLK
jgi:hypothetical protein